MKQFTLLTILLLSGCSTLKIDVEERVHQGDSYTQVKETLKAYHGPYLTPKSENQFVAMYMSNHYICEIQLDRGYVENASCETNPGYVNPLAAMLQGAGQGLQNAHHTNCVTTGSPGFYTTNCN